MKKILTFVSVSLILLVQTIGFGQINQMQFGKNRVQHHRSFDEWSEYESENFITYWYGQGRFIGQSAAQMAEMDYDEIQKTLEYRLNDKMEIIVYTDISDVHQSNIGADETFVTQTGEVKVIGEKIFVFFDGDHTHLRTQIREGITTVFLNAMLFGSNLQEMVQNAISLNLPEWFKQGLIAHIGGEWNSELDDKLRDIFQSKKYKNFNKFALAEPRMAGHAFWNYIATQFGKANVSNLLYLTRINRSLDDAMMYVMGSGYEPMSLACMEYYRKRYEKELADATKVADLKQVKFKNKFKLPLSQPKLSPDGKRVAYVLNEIGKWKVYIQDVQTGKRDVILRGGVRNPFQATDYNYPLLAWNPDNQRISVVFEKRDVIKLLNYNFMDKKKTIEDFQPDFQRVYSIDYVNAKDMVVSAAKKGFSDIYLYNILNRNYKQISSDFWDDLDATYVNFFDHKGVIFSSNRLNERLETEKLDSVLPVNNFDLFYKDLEDTSKTLVRISNTPDANERQAIAVDSTYFSFLSDESGVNNRQMAYLKKVLDRVDTVFYVTNEFKEVVPITVMQDSARLFSDTLKIDSSKTKEIFKTMAFVKNNTNYNRNIIAQHSSPRTGKLVETFNTEGVPRLNIQKLEPDSAFTPTFTKLWEAKKKIQIKTNGTKNPRTSAINPPAQNDVPKESAKIDSTGGKPIVTEATPQPKDTVKKVDIDNYVFQSEFDDKETPKTTQITVEKPKTDKTAQTETETTVAILDPSVILQRESDSEKKMHVFRQGRIVPYRLKFKNDYFSTKLDNDLLFGGLDSYAANPQTYQTPPMGILGKGNFKDLLEDYQLEGGIRVPTTFDGYEAYVFFDDRKHQLDKRYALYYRTKGYSDVNINGAETKTRYQTALGQYELRYPFDTYTRLQVTGTIRTDRYTQLSTDAKTLQTPTIDEQRIGAKIEYVYDNTMSVDMNVKNGTRYKIWADFVKRFELDFTDKFSFKFKDGYMGILSFDARHYERVFKHSVFAVRGAGSTTFGPEKILYYLGGADNELFANFSDNVNTPAGNYGFQTLAANMRGFDRNIRNGTSYALINSELRIPIFKYFSSKPLVSSFWRNFQLMAFFDIGTAWHGPNPFKRDNPLNTITLPKDDPNSPVQLTVSYFKDPIVASYGVGARALIFGYLVRADYGWGIETRTIQKPMLHISLGTDF